MQRKQHQPDGTSHHKGAKQHRALLDGVPRAERLRRERHGAHPEEGEQPESAIEHQR